MLLSAGGGGGGRRTWRLVLVLVAFWLLVMLYMTLSLGPGEGDQQSAATRHIQRQLDTALKELGDLKRQRDELDALVTQIRNLQGAALGGNRQQIEKLSKKLADSHNQLAALRTSPEDGELAVGGGLPSAEYESQRRLVETGVRELWFYLQAQIISTGKLLQDREDVVQRLHNFHARAAERYRSVMGGLADLAGMDGGSEWRDQEAEELAILVQARLNYLQNPPDCDKARKVVCNLNKGCGYGCQLHHVTYCLMVAYGTQRTLILESKGWRYSPQGWERFFLPLSNNCTSQSGASKYAWAAPEKIKDIQVIDLPIIDSMYPKPNFLPLAIPEDLAPRLKRLHGHPFVWWIGQFIRYVTRPQLWLQDEIAKTKDTLGYAKPIVGIQVRRTDKVGTEAAFHGVDEYMFHVNQYYDYLETRQTVDQRRVYLATDDAKVLTEAREKYKDYVFVSDNSISQSASLGSRYTERSLQGVITDIELLSQSDYLVCTFSSQVCRVAYEIMQTLSTDASSLFTSLDDIYYYGGQNGHNQVAIADHTPQEAGEIELKVGDLVGVAGNHWEGYSKGLNKRTGQTGLYPSFKVQDHIDIVAMPTYPEAKPNR